MAAINWEAVARSALHPIRVQILERAAAAPDERFSPVELASEFDERLPNLSYHVRMLAEEGWIVKAGTAARRGAVEHYYRASKKLLR
jgi:DNA-binding transcriptional ArsR family regulator